MDPIALATVTTAVVHLAMTATTSLVSAATKDMWGEIKKRLGWKTEPTSEDLALAVARKLQGDPDLAKWIVAKLQSVKQVDGVVPQYASLVQHVKADKLVIAEHINVVNM